MIDATEIIVSFLAVSAVGALLFFLYQKRRKSIGASLSSLENPTPIKTELSTEDSYNKIRTLLINESFGAHRWTIKEDNPRGMLIAILTFEEDLGNQAAVAKRQLILTVSIQEQEEEEGRIVRLIYSVYAPFGRTTCDEVLNGTTAAIGNVLQGQ